jgi:hypothetical protein
MTTTAEPWLQPVEDVAALVDVDPRVGLSSAEANARLLRAAPNA